MTKPEGFLVNNCQKMKALTVGPASKDVPESTMAAQPPSQTPEKNYNDYQNLTKFLLRACKKY